MYILVFAPGGLGVREAVLAFVFSNIASVELIAVYAAMNRIVWVVAEVLFGLVGIFQKRILSLSTDLTHETEHLSEDSVNEPTAEE